MAILTFPGGNKLIRPKGRRPAYDPSHPAAHDIGLSVIATTYGKGSGTANTSEFKELRIGTQRGGGTNTIQGTMDPIIGVANSLGEFAVFVFAGLPAAVQSSGTIAAIFRTPNSAETGTPAMIMNTGVNTGGFQLIADTTTGTLGASAPNGPSPFGTSMNVASLLQTNRQYFAVMSWRPSFADFLLRDLATGQTWFTINNASVSAPATDTGSLAIGGAGGSSGSASQMAAVMYSPGKYLGMSALLTWGNDPWSFWYPKLRQQTLTMVGTASAPPATKNILTLLGAA